MSRIGKKTITVPKGVTVTLDGQNVTVKGPKGERAWTVAEEVEIKQEGDELSLTPRSDTQRARAMWGLSRTLVDNMVTVELHVVLEYGVRIPQVAWQLQNDIRQAVEQMTGKSVKTVNVVVQSVRLPGGAKNGNSEEYSL